MVVLHQLQILLHAECNAMLDASNKSLAELGRRLLGLVYELRNPLHDYSRALCYNWIQSPYTCPNRYKCTLHAVHALL